MTRRETATFAIRRQTYLWLGVYSAMSRKCNSKKGCGGLGNGIAQNTQPRLSAWQARPLGREIQRPSAKYCCNYFRTAQFQTQESIDGNVCTRSRGHTCGRAVAFLLPGEKQCVLE